MFAFRLRGNPISALAVSTLVLSLGGCSLSPFDDDGFAKSVGRAVKLAPNEKAAPEFVEASRKEQSELEYVPVGAKSPARIPLRPAHEIEGDMLLKKSQNEAKAALARTVSPYDGKIEPGYKPLPAPPAPPPGPALAIPKAQPQPVLARDGTTPNLRKKVPQPAAKKSED